MVASLVSEEVGYTHLRSWRVEGRKGVRGRGERKG